MDTLSRIRNIFHSGSHAFNGEQQPIVEIAFLVDNGYLTVESFPIADKETYLRLAQNISENPHAHDAAAGGGHTHVALKILVAEYLKRECGTSVRFEQPLCGYVPDVLSENKTMVAECGHTQNAGKMLDYFRQAHIRECMQVPYPDANDDLVVGHRFVSVAGLNEFLDRLDERKNSNIKKILTRRSSQDG